jgi:hypothetical protein
MLLKMFLMLLLIALNHLSTRLFMNTLFLKKTATKLFSFKPAVTQTTKIAMSVLLTGLVMTSVQAAPKKSATAKEAAPVDIQTIMVEKCTSEATAAKITDAKSAQKVCGCTIGVQASNLKLGEFWAIQSSAMNGKDPRTLPALQKIQPQLDKCREGIVFTPPAAPAAAPAASKP